MGMIVKKKQILTATLIIALAAAVGVNWYYSKPQRAASEETSQYERDVSGNLGDSLLVAGKVQTSESESAEDQSDETTEQTEPAQDASSESYFAQARLKRTESHDEIVNEIESLLNDENLSQEDESRISILLSDFQKDVKAETDIENLISAKTGGECVVIINDATAQVILQKNTLNDSVLLQITEIVEKNSDISAENLTIIEAK